MLRIRALATIAVVFCASTVGLTQRPAPTRPQPNAPTRTNVIQLEIQLVNDGSRPLAIQALVEVNSMGAVNLRNYTNMDGRVTFSVPPGSNYRVQVSGAEIENGSSSFEILPGEMFHHEYVTVKLKEQAAARGPGGIVSLANLNIPEKARKEYEKGMNEFADKKWGKAREHFDKAVREYPKYDAAYNNMGVAAMQQNDVGAAREAFSRATEANPSNAAAARNLGRIYLTRDNDLVHAKEMFQRSLSAEPRDAETLALLAYTQFQTGDLDAALSNARKVHDLGPDDHYPFAHLLAGRVLERKGDGPGAAAEYHTYLKEAEGSPDAQVAREGLARLGEK